MLRATVFSRFKESERANMKIVLAPDSFKECMSAQEAARAMKEAVHRVNGDVDVTLLPVADGGEGTLEVLTYATNGKTFKKTVTGPLGEPVTATYSILGDQKTAVVEMAQASGLHLVAPDNRNPLLTTTFGTGELMKAALRHDISNLIVTIGGSATNDCGIGMLQALGVKVTTKSNVSIGFGGGSLGEVEHIDLSEIEPKLKKVKLSIACDVTNPLIGPKGASHIFGPQKGATPSVVEQLDKNLSHVSTILEKVTGKRLKDIPGAGAAGGLGAALLVCGGELKPGIDLVLDALHFEEKVSGANFIFTGEGRIDHQTPGGKVIAGIVKRANKERIPVIAFAGSVKTGYESLYNEGLLSAHSITLAPCSLEEALANGRENLAHTAESIMRVLTCKF